MKPSQFDEIVAEARRIAFGEDGQGGKHKDYNAQDKDLYKAIGLPGRCSDIWRKAIRFPAAMETRQFDLKLYRDALDLLVYCVMYCVVWKDSKTEEALMENRTAFMAALKNIEGEGRDDGCGIH
ncbi:MAG: hypothetical protein ABIG95_02630 [Candidatus Woesearchaeota archaeon]